MAESDDLQKDVATFTAELTRLEAEYNMYFAGRLQRPPWEQRKRVELMAKRLDRTHIANYGQRFRFTTLQTRLAKASGLWDRGLRAREEGRPGPFAQPRGRLVRSAALASVASSRDLAWSPSLRQASLSWRIVSIVAGLPRPKTSR